MAKETTKYTNPQTSTQLVSMYSSAAQALLGLYGKAAGLGKDGAKVANIFGKQILQAIGLEGRDVSKMLSALERSLIKGDGKLSRYGLDMDPTGYDDPSLMQQGVYGSLPSSAQSFGIPGMSSSPFVPPYMMGPAQSGMQPAQVSPMYASNMPQDLLGVYANLQKKKRPGKASKAKQKYTE